MAYARAAAMAAALVGGMGTAGIALAQSPGGDHGRSGVEEIIVTASPLSQRRFDVVQGTSVLAGEALDRALSASLGETLDRLPGVSQTAFGQGASRPVIRGLGGDRIRVLVGGIGTIDASTTSPDHAPAVDLATAKRVEVVRGPSTLLYGSNAVGGVVNVLDGRIPLAAPEGGANGFARLGHGSNADERLAAAGVDVALGSHLVAHLDAFWRETDNFKVDGYVRSAALRALEEEEHEEHEEDHGDDDHEEEEPRGRVDNSDLEQKGLTGGLSFVGDWGYFGASVGHTATEYGIPGGGHAHADDHGDDDHGDEGGHEDVRIDLEQTRVDLMGDLRLETALFETARLRFGWADYEHTELEGGEVGTRFLNDGWEGRLELVQRRAGGYSGAIGAQILSRDFAAIGDEAFVPPSETGQIGLFTVQRIEHGPWSLEAGGRLERQTIQSDDVDFDRDFTTASLSGGVGYSFGQGWMIGASLSRTERAPNAEELLSDGPHLATGTYELGDADLGEETALGVEATLRHTGERISGSLNGFITAYDDFIFERFTGEEEDGLPVALYSAAEASFRGIEAELSVEAWRSADGHALFLDGSAEYVRAGNRDVDEPLPRIPPLTLRGGVEFDAGNWATRMEVVWADDQNRTAAFELPTEDYTVFNASIDWHPFDGRDLMLVLEGRNLTDEEVRLSTSFLKDRVPQPGRDIRLLLRAGF